MNKNKGWITLVGFLLVGVGFLSIVLSLVGAKLTFLAWVDAPGPLFGFIAKLLLIIAGMVIIFLAQTDFEGESN